MAARIFVSYSHKDEALRDELEVRLAMLKRQGLVDVWHDRRMLAGDRLDWSISKELDDADVILLLVSPDFLASDYCYKIEKARALERHREGTARLISVIVRPCDWEHTDLRHFLVTPKDGLPVTKWPDRDDAFLDVAKSIRKAIEELGVADKPKPVHEFIERPQAPQEPQPPEVLPRSSNLRLKKEFTKADEDQFVLDAFEFLKRFFQGSLDELQTRNDGIVTRYREVDANTFCATIYRNGDKVAACTIRLSGTFGNGISYSYEENAASGTFNEHLSAEHDDQKLFLQPMGMAHFGGIGKESVLSHEGAAEYYWGLLIQPLQGR